MRIMLLKTSACAALLLAATACGEGEGSGGNSAGKTGSLATEFERSADALIAKVGQPGEKAEMPAAGDPAVKACDAQASKAMAALGTPALPVDGFESFGALCGKTAAIVGAYAGAGVGDPNGAAGAAQQQKMTENVERHLDQMFTPLLFAAHCSAAHLPFLQEQVDPADSSKAAALQQIRAGAYAQMVGLIQMAAAPDLDAGRKGRIADLLAQDAPKFAIALSAGQRKEIAGMAKELSPLLPEASRDEADKLRTGIEAAPCGKLCAM